jgi:hypothetical protein
VASVKPMYDGAFSGLAATGELNQLLDELYGSFKPALAGGTPPGLADVASHRDFQASSAFDGLVIQFAGLYELLGSVNVPHDGCRDLHGMAESERGF